MAVLLFPGQGSQSVGMGKVLCEEYLSAEEWLSQADAILDFNLSEIMKEGDAEELKKTSVTQPAILVNSFIRYKLNQSAVNPSSVAGHSLGEFTALIANGCLSFEQALKLVLVRANAMQAACDNTEGTMAAILGMEDKQVEDLCSSNDASVVVAANYNCPGQLVISGAVTGIEAVVEQAKEAGARRALILPVNGAFHSPLMEPAKLALQAAINETNFEEPKIPIYQNVTGRKETDPEVIKNNLIAQLTSPVLWTQSMQNMIADGEDNFIEFGAKVLSGFIKKVDRKLPVTQY